MKRIAIIGSPGGGKSTLAVQLGRALDLAVHHLDRLYWRPGWERTPGNEWRALQERLCAAPRWIVDGNYGSSLDIRLAACDTVVWLDLPPWICLLGVLWRYVAYRRGSRPDVGEGCPERLDWAFVRFVWSFRRFGRPRIVERLKELDSAPEVIVLHSRREMARWLDRVAGRQLH